MRRGNGIFAICDTETEYAFRFMEYLSHKRNIMFEIRVFTTAEKLLQFAESHAIEILLISERSMCDGVACLEVGKLIILSETSGALPYPGCLNIYKYQSSDTVVREIMESYGSENHAANQPASLQNRNLQVYGVYSPVPYDQQLLLSVALGMELAKDRRVLYLNLESFSGFEEFTGQTYEKNISDLIYLFRKNGSGFSHRLNGMIYSIGDLDFLPPVRTPSDYLEITGEEWIRFFETIAGSSNYDAMVLDIGCAIPDVMLLLAYCTRIWMPLRKDALSAARKKEFQSLLETTDNGIISEKLETVTPPEISCSSSGLGLLESLPWSGMGKFVASLCTALT